MNLLPLLLPFAQGLIKRLFNKESVVAVPVGISGLLSVFLAGHFGAGTAEQLSLHVTAVLTAGFSLYQFFRAGTLPLEGRTNRAKNFIVGLFGRIFNKESNAAGPLTLSAVLVGALSTQFDAQSAEYLAGLASTVVSALSASYVLLRRDTKLANE